MSGDDSTTRSFDRREFLKRAGIGVAVASVPFAASPGAWAGLARKSATKPLRIGNLLTLSGPNSAPPIDVRRGFVAYVLAHGHRIGGRKIQFIDADDANDPATAIRQVQKLVNEDQVDVIEGIFFSSILLGVRDTIDQLQVPTIVANAAANALSRDRKSNYIFRTSYSNYQLGVPLGPWAVRTFGKGGVAAITANYAAGQESAAAFKDAYEKAGGTLNTTIFTPFPTTPDYQPYLQQAADGGAKGVWAFTAGGGEAIKFVKTYKQFGFDKQFQLFGSNNMTDPQSVLDSEGDAALGIRTTANWAPTLKNTENVLFLKQYDKFGVGTAVGLRRARLRRGAVPRPRSAQGARRHEQQAALPQRDGERRHLAVARRQADDGPEHAQRDRAGVPPDRREDGVGLHAAADLDPRDLQGAGRLRRPARSAR